MSLQHKEEKSAKKETKKELIDRNEEIDSLGLVYMGVRHVWTNERETEKLDGGVERESSCEEPNGRYILSQKPVSLVPEGETRNLQCFADVPSYVLLKCKMLCIGTSQESLRLAIV